MKQDEATQLTAKLLAAYSKSPEKMTVAVYVERLGPLDYQRAKRAIDELICSERWLPTVAVILEVYNRLEEQARQARDLCGLPMPPVTEEQRKENLKRARGLLAQIGRRT